MKNMTGMSCLFEFFGRFALTQDYERCRKLSRKCAQLEAAKDKAENEAKYANQECHRLRKDLDIERARADGQSIDGDYDG